MDSVTLAILRNWIYLLGMRPRASSTSADLIAKCGKAYARILSKLSESNTSEKMKKLIYTVFLKYGTPECCNAKSTLHSLYFYRFEW